MAVPKTRSNRFSRNISSVTSAQTPGLKHGPNGTNIISSGIPNLDKILGDGFPLGSLVMVMEDIEPPYHMLLLRNFMSQGLVHKQALLYANLRENQELFLVLCPTQCHLKMISPLNMIQNKKKV